jgi:pimeloyl-ACP methyl ester carboxylesterase
VELLHGADRDSPVLGPAGWRTVSLEGRAPTFACDIPGPSITSPTVVLLHGLMMTGSLNWAPFMAALSEHFRVVVLDHRGHGQGALAPFTLEDCADDAVALLDALGIRRAIFVGYSMGGPIAQLAWRRHPSRVRGLVLCATAADFRLNPPGRLVLSVLDEFTAALSVVPRQVRLRGLRSILPGLVADRNLRLEIADAFERHDDASIRVAARVVRRFCSTDWIVGAPVPTAVVVTQQDRLVTPAQQLHLAALIPGAAVVPVDADHMACLTAPERFSPALVEACLLVVRSSGRWRAWLGRLLVRLPRRRPAGRGI